MHIPPTAKAILFWALWALPLSALVFLLLSQFFTAWNGHAVSFVPPAEGTEPAHYRVLVIEEDGSDWLAAFPSDVVAKLGIPSDPRALPPPKVPDGSPRTSKNRFALHYLVEMEEASHEVLPTTSPASLVTAILVLAASFFLRNMATSGHPLDMSRVEGPHQNVGSRRGNVMNPVTEGKTVSRKEPPPPKRRTGVGRRG